MALALAKGTDAADALAKGNVKPQALEKAIAGAAQGPHRRLRVGRERL